MHKGRLEAFSDGVFAIVITIMVLELKVPHGGEATFTALQEHVGRPFLCYALSFVYLGIYWNNHHHLLQASTHVTGAVLWANLHLLFWLSLFPFVTTWMDENPAAPHPVALYGVVLILAAIAYYALVRALLACHGADSALGKAIGSDFKGRISVAIYAAGIALTSWKPWLGIALYTLVALIWLVPDRRIERTLVQ
jgi:uncharacterized membrane protein